MYLGRNRLNGAVPISACIPIILFSSLCLVACSDGDGTGADGGVVADMGMSVGVDADGSTMPDIGEGIVSPDAGPVRDATVWGRGLGRSADGVSRWGRGVGPNAEGDFRFAR